MSLHPPSADRGCLHKSIPWFEAGPHLLPLPGRIPVKALLSCAAQTTISSTLLAENN